MKIIHRVTFRTDGPATKFFEAEGFKIKDGIINGFDVSEDDTRWNRIRQTIEHYGNDIIGDFQYKTEFTRGELYSSRYLKLSPKWHFEFPQPSDDFGYRETTYKPEIGCRKCEIGLEQHNPFSLKKAPKWGKRNILQINWVFGDYFVSKAMRDNLVGRIPGLCFLEVMQYPKGTVLDDIFQLVVERQVPFAIAADMGFEICDSCGGKKYLPHTRGFFPRPLETSFSIAKSQEYFGSGGSARQEMIIDKATYGLLIEAGISGVDFVPCT